MPSKLPAVPDRQALAFSLLQAKAKVFFAREKVRRLLDDSRETLVKERAMWEQLITQSDVLRVTGCRSIEGVRKARQRRLAQAEENVRGFQKIEGSQTAMLAEIERMICEVFRG
jgi:hypothetical protein